MWIKRAVILAILSLVLSKDCDRDNDCSTMEVCVDKECEHKALFPIEGLEIVGSLLTILISGLSNSAGIGGGPLNTILLNVFFYFNTFKSIALAQVVIFGGSLMSIGLKIPARHPTRDRALIDYELIAYLISPLLAGTSLGVILHLIFPD